MKQPKIQRLSDTINLSEGQKKKGYAFILTTAILVLLVYLSDLESAANSFRQAERSLLFAAFLAANLPLLIYAKVWEETLNISNIQISYHNSVKLVLANTFVNNLTPFGNIGGEAAATYYISELTGKNKSEVFSSILSASIINFAPLIALTVTAAILLDYIGTLQLVSGLFALVMIYAISRTDMLRLKNLGKTVQKPVLQVLENMRQVKNHKRTVTLLLILTHLATFSSIFSVHLIGLSLGYNLPVYLLTVAVPLARLGNYAPTPGGSGAYEAALIGTLTFFFQIPVQGAVLTTVLYRSITYYTGIVAGYIGISLVEAQGKNLFNKNTT